MNQLQTRRVLVSAIWATFFVFGFQLAGIGPLISVLAGRTGVSIETVGILFTVQSFASLASASMIGMLIERFSIRRVILMGLICVTLGMAGFYFSQSLVLLLLSGAVLGFGVAFIDAGGQLLVIELYGDQSARPLNSLHFLFSVGAVIGPFLAVQIGINVFAVATFIMLIAVPLTYFTIPRNLKIGARAMQIPRSGSLYLSPVLWFFALLFLFYVGLEIGVGNWTTEYLATTTAFDRSAAGVITSMYWFSFMFSRLVVTAVGSRLSFERQLVLSIGLALLGSIGYIASVGNQTGAVISTLVIGFSFGPIYPAAFAIVAKRFAGSAGRAAGAISAAGSIGAMSIVPIQGVLLERGGGSVMAAFIVVISIGMVVAYYLADRGANGR